MVPQAPWSCLTCTLENDRTANVCAACGTQMNRSISNSEVPKPGSGAGGDVYLQGTNPATVGGAFSNSTINSSATAVAQLGVASNVAEGRGNTGGLFDSNSHPGTTTGVQLDVASNVAGGRGNTGGLLDSSNHPGTTTGAQLGVTSNVAGDRVNDPMSLRKKKKRRDTDIQASDESQKENEKPLVAAGKPSHKRRRMNYSRVLSHLWWMWDEQKSEHQRRM